MSNKPIIESQESLQSRYARYRQQLCQTMPDLDKKLRQGAMIRTLFSGLALEFEVILLDAFGVLNVGSHPIPGSPEAVAVLVARKTPLLVVTNNASQSPLRLLARLGAMGFALEPVHILSSGMAVAGYIESSGMNNSLYFLVGSRDSTEFYAPRPEVLMVNRLEGSLELAKAEYVLFCSNQDYYGGEQERLLTQLLQHRPVPLVLANPDLVAPKGDGRMEIVAGFTAMDLADQFHIPMEGIGKPFAPIFQEVLHRFPNIPPERILMVGDTLETDILGAKAMGFATCLTLSGAYEGKEFDLEQQCRSRGICPDYVIARLGD